MRAFRAFLHHRATNLVIALVLIATSSIDVWESFRGSELTMTLGGVDMSVGVHNGVLAYGVVHFMRAVAEFFADVEHGIAPAGAER
jgi:hypothetical protein